MPTTSTEATATSTTWKPSSAATATESSTKKATNPKRFNDIDFCLKVRKAGYLVVYNPYAQFYHYESKSRGQEDSADKVARFQQEIGLFGERWGELLENGDPYYNPNLTLDKADFSLKE